MSLKFHCNSSKFPRRPRLSRDCNDELFGEEGAEPLMDSFDSYIVVSVLTATASFAAMFEASADDKFYDQFPSAHTIWVATCSLCSLSGIYATVVFSFSSTYGHTAVGTGRVHIYEAFLESTAEYRRRAFNMYLLSLWSFIALLVMTAVERVETRFQWSFLVLLLAASLWMYQDWNAIMTAAAPIFAEEQMQKESKKKRQS